MKHRERLDHFESDGQVSLASMRGRARELAERLDHVEAEFRALYDVASRVEDRFDVEVTMGYQSPEWTAALQRAKDALGL